MFSYRYKYGDIEIERRLNGSELVAFVSFLSMVALPWVALLLPTERPYWIYLGAVAIWSAGILAGLIAVGRQKKRDEELVVAREQYISDSTRRGSLSGGADS